MPPLRALALATKNAEPLETMRPSFSTGRRSNAAPALLMLHNRTDADGVNQAIDELLSRGREDRFSWLRRWARRVCDLAACPTLPILFRGNADAVPDEASDSV